MSLPKQWFGALLARLSRGQVPIDGSAWFDPKSVPHNAAQCVASSSEPQPARRLRARGWINLG